VYTIRDGRSAEYAVTTINRRLAAISGFFGYREMLDPTLGTPTPEAERPAGLPQGSVPVSSAT
jgi:hypothetical protein